MLELHSTRSLKSNRRNSRAFKRLADGKNANPGLVSLIFVSWNLIREFLSRLNALHHHLANPEIHCKPACETSPFDSGTL
jgi:hypothetical protein